MEAILFCISRVSEACRAMRVSMINAESVKYHRCGDDVMQGGGGGGGGEKKRNVGCENKSGSKTFDRCEKENARHLRLGM